MRTITLEDTLTAYFQAIAAQRHIPVEQLIADVLQRYLEEHLNIIVAGQTLVTSDLKILSVRKHKMTQ